MKAPSGLFPTLELVGVRARAVGAGPSRRCASNRAEDPPGGPADLLLCRVRRRFTCSIPGSSTPPWPSTKQRFATSLPRTPFSAWRKSCARKAGLTRPSRPGGVAHQADGDDFLREFLETARGAEGYRQIRKDGGTPGTRGSPRVGRRRVTCRRWTLPAPMRSWVKRSRRSATSTPRLPIVHLVWCF